MKVYRGSISVLLLVGMACTALAPRGALVRAQDDPAAPARHGADGKLRILHFGDSHTAADTMQIALRQHFQQSMGDGGAGVFLPCTSRASRCSKGWTLQTRPVPGVPDDFLGLPGMLLQTSQSGESIQVEGEFSTFRAFFLRQPGGGRVRFFVNGTPIGDMDLSGAWRQAVPYIGWSPRRERQRLEIRTLGGAVRLLSLSFENGTSGVIYSPLGVVGARAENLLHIDETAFATQLQYESPDFVILAYGTNESSGAGVDEAAYAARIEELVDRIHRAVPGAAVLLVGPPDRGGPDSAGSLPALAGVIRGIEAAARQKNVAFLNLESAMGGPGTATQWAMANPPLAQPDRTHFTPLGYQRLASYIAGAVAVPAPAPALVTAKATSKVFKILTPDGRIWLTNDPETVQSLLGRGGTVQGN
jgi:lysophospholipase L1-like esterase